MLLIFTTSSEFLYETLKTKPNISNKMIETGQGNCLKGELFRSRMKFIMPSVHLGKTKSGFEFSKR